MISNFEPVAGTQPQPPFVRPIGNEFQIGDLLIRRVGGDQFLIWNRDHEMLETDAGKLESTLREFFNDEF
jgi:hypothetical protein